MLQGVDLARTEAHIDQHLRALAQGLASLRQGLAAALERQQYLQRGNDRITGGGVVAAHDMPGVFTPHQPAALQQLGHDVTVANLGPHERNVQVLECKLQAQVTHQRTDHPALQLAPLVQVPGDDEQQLVAIDDRAGMIDHQHPVTITVEGNAQVGVTDQHCRLQRLDVGRAAAFVDVQAVRLRMQHRHFGTQLTEHARRDFVGGAMGAVDDQLEPFEAGAGRHTALAKLDVAASGIVDARNLAQLARADHRHRLVKKLLDHQLDFVGQLGALA
ncbi:hypothetical protein D3C78_1236280 [compost metagenome]